jgi:hypothetical protein
MVVCPKCGNAMEKWGGAWFACPSCKLAGHLDSLDWLCAVLTEARIRAEGRYASDGTLLQI